MMRAYISQQAQLVRAFYGGIGKTAVIFPSSFFVAVALGQLSLGLVLYARAVLAATSMQIGLLAGIWSVAYIAGCLLIRPLLSHILPRFLILISTAAMTVLVLAMVIFESYAVLLVLYFFFGLVLGLFWPPMMGWLYAGYEGRRLGRVMAYYNLSWCCGSVISPFICGWLSEYNPRYPILLASGLFLLVFVFVAGASLVLARIKNDRGTGAVHDTAPGESDRSCSLRYPAWIGLFSVFFGMGITVAVFPLVALQEWQVTPTVIGFLFTARSLAIALGFVLLGRVHVWHFRRTPILAAPLLAGLVFCGLAWSGSVPAAALLFACLGLSVAMSYSASVFHGVAGCTNRARRMAIHEAVLSGGVVMGSVAGGWLYERMDSASLFTLVAAGIIGVGVIQFIVGQTTTGHKPE